MGKHDLHDNRVGRLLLVIAVSPMLMSGAVLTFYAPFLGCLVCGALIVSRLASAATGTRAPMITTVLLAMTPGLDFVVWPRSRWL